MRGELRSGDGRVPLPTLTATSCRYSSQQLGISGKEGTPVNRITVFAGGAAALSFAVPAMAQGSDATAPAGFRIEALAGWDHPSADGQHADGFLFGAGAGFDFAVGHAVSLGVDVEASDSTAKQSG